MTSDEIRDLLKRWRSLHRPKCVCGACEDTDAFLALEPAPPRENRCDYRTMGLRCCLPVHEGEAHRVSIEDVIAWGPKCESPPDPAPPPAPVPHFHSDDDVNLDRPCYAVHAPPPAPSEECGDEPAPMCRSCRGKGGFRGDGRPSGDHRTPNRKCMDCGGTGRATKETP